MPPYRVPPRVLHVGASLLFAAVIAIIFVGLWIMVGNQPVPTEPPQTEVPSAAQTSPAITERKVVQVCNADPNSPGYGEIIEVYVEEAGRYKPVGDAACR